MTSKEDLMEKTRNDKPEAEPLEPIQAPPAQATPKKAKATPEAPPPRSAVVACPSCGHMMALRMDEVFPVG